MRNSQLLTRLFATAAAALWMSTASSSLPATAADDEQFKTADDLAVYLGVVPAEIIKGPSPHSAERPMHGRTPMGAHEYHIVAAVFDVTTGARVSDATVTAQVSGLGLSGTRKRLESMAIAGTTTYGSFFDLPGRDLYTVRLTIERSGGSRPIVLQFKYHHRQR
jgi:hypothetical protein